MACPSPRSGVHPGRRSPWRPLPGPADARKGTQVQGAGCRSGTQGATHGTTSWQPGHHSAAQTVTQPRQPTSEPSGRPDSYGTGMGGPARRSMVARGGGSPAVSQGGFRSLFSAATAAGIPLAGVAAAWMSGPAPGPFRDDVGFSRRASCRERARSVRSALAGRCRPVAVAGPAGTSASRFCCPTGGGVDRLFPPSVCSAAPGVGFRYARWVFRECLELRPGAPYGNRTRVSAVKGRRPGPLDEGDRIPIYRIAADNGTGNAADERLAPPFDPALPHAYAVEKVPFPSDANPARRPGFSRQQTWKDR